MKLVAPLGLKDVAQRGCPILRVDQENKSLLVAVDMTPENYLNNFFQFLRPTANASTRSIRPYAPYYESMIPGDSSSPSILLYKTTSGVIPFLISQVTSADLGNGPNLSALAGDIQEVIEQFGDTDIKYRLGVGPEEFTRTQPLFPKPTCTLDVLFKKRTATKGSCNYTLRMTNNNFFVNVPLVFPQTPNWKFSKDKKTALGVLPCDGNNFETNYIARVKGPSGHGVCAASVK